MVAYYIIDLPICYFRLECVPSNENLPVSLIWKHLERIRPLRYLRVACFASGRNKLADWLSASGLLTIEESKVKQPYIFGVFLGIRTIEELLFS